MTQISAFVGHSFIPEDKEVVRIFLDYFDTVKNMNIGFTWEHAEAAETKELSTKVQKLMHDKNLFIGLCTKKELVIEESRLSRKWFSKTILKAPENYFSPKTSDWIIQEIGLAIGLNLELILLIEKDLRKPGGLQGNVEYVEFSRDNPERSFKKILEMIQSLRPKITAKSVSMTQTQDAPQKPSEDKDDTKEDFLKPKDDWTRRDYQFAMLISIMRKNEENVKKINDSYLKSNDGQLSHNVQSWKACCELYRLRHTDGNLSKLQDIATNYPQNGKVQEFLGMAYEHFQEYETAGDMYVKAVSLVTDDQEYTLNVLSRAIVVYMKVGRKQKARELWKEMKQHLNGNERIVEILLNTARECAKLDGNEEKWFGATEYLLTFKPDDYDIRFRIAYDYSEKNINSLSLLHYLRIPALKRESVVWNNMGVAYQNFDLFCKSVESFRKAEKSGDTLAMSNLAKRYISAGFLTEASDICNRAVRMDDYNKNIGESISRIKNLPQEEEKKEEGILKKAELIHQFYTNYGKAVIGRGPGNHTGKWQGPVCELLIAIEGDKFTAKGSYKQQKAYGLGELYGWSLGGVPAAKDITHNVQYVGQIDGYAVKCSLTITDDDTLVSPTILGSIGTSKDVLMIVDKTLSKIDVIEKQATDDYRLYSLNRIQIA